MSNSRFAVALHVLALLAIEKKDEPTPSDYLAASAGTNPVVIRRLLPSLRKAGLVTIQAGCTGGASLARPPEEISLLAIYCAVGEIEPFSIGSRTPDPDCICGRNLRPVLVEVFDRVEQVMANYLSRMTLADIVGEIEQRETRSQRFVADALAA